MNENFISTKEHKRFIELHDACKEQTTTLDYVTNYQGLGTTVSATKYTNWNVINEFNGYKLP